MVIISRLPMSPGSLKCTRWSRMGRARTSPHRHRRGRRPSGRSRRLRPSGRPGTAGYAHRRAAPVRRMSADARSDEVPAAYGQEGADPRRWKALTVCLVAGFMTLLDVSIVNVALPSIRTGLDAPQSTLQWVVSGYALAFGLVLVPAGRFGDMHGRRNAFVFGVVAVHPGQRGGRSRPGPDLAGHRAARPGRGGRDHQSADQRADPAAFPGRGARPGVRAARRHHRHLDRDRPAARRAADLSRRRSRRLALGLLRQRAGRHRWPWSWRTATSRC